MFRASSLSPPLFLLFSSLLLSSPAFAQEVNLRCGPRDDLAQTLADTWGEVPVFQGLHSDGLSLIEIFANPGGTWTAVVVSADGTACPVAAGDQWIGFRVIAGVDG